MRQLQAQLVLMLAVGERQLDVGKRVPLQLVSPVKKKSNRSAFVVFVT